MHGAAEHDADGILCICMRGAAERDAAGAFGSTLGRTTVDTPTAASYPDLRSTSGLLVVGPLLRQRGWYTPTPRFKGLLYDTGRSYKKSVPLVVF